MSTKKIYLVRHGQTDYNLKGVVQGSGIDASINETGRKQAEAFYEAHKHIAFDRIYYTGLQRTRQSIAKFLELGIPHEGLPELNEISWGEYEGVPMDHDENEYYQHMLNQWAEGKLDYSIKGGESPIMVYERLKKGLDYILGNGGETILICMHGRAIRIMLSVMLNYDLRFMDVFEHHNLGCYELTLQKSGHFRIDRYNNMDHLKVKGLIG